MKSVNNSTSSDAGFKFWQLPIVVQMGATSSRVERELKNVVQFGFGVLNRAHNTFSFLHIKSSTLCGALESGSKNHKVLKAFQRPGRYALHQHLDASQFCPKTPPQELRKFAPPSKGHTKNANITAHQLSDVLSFSGARAI